MQAVLTEEQVRENIAKLAKRQEQDVMQAEARFDGLAERFAYVQPLLLAADAAIEAIENVEERFMLGLDPIDIRTRGCGAKELIIITGFAHAGKTQLVNTMILNNRRKRILFFSMDDPAEMILIKLTCMLHDVSAEDLEVRIRRGDNEAKLWLRQASQEFPNLSIVDQSLGLDGMDIALAEYEQAYGAQPQCVIIDYLDSMIAKGAEDGGVQQKVADLKRWVKDKVFPTIVLHQNTRSGGGPGEPITLTSMGYGGEKEATMVLGVRRKRDCEDLEQGVRDLHRNTVTLHLVKNKRPPGKLTMPDGIDFMMEPTTGLIRTMTEADWPTRREGMSAQDAMKAVRGG